MNRGLYFVVLLFAVWIAERHIPRIQGWGPSVSVLSASSVAAFRGRATDHRRILRNRVFRSAAACA